MVMKHWLRFSVILATLGAACLAPAPIADPEASGRTRLPIYSEAERTKQQAEQKVFGEVGVVPVDTDKEVAPSPMHDPDAADVVASAAREVQARSEGRQRERGRAFWNPVLMLGLFGVAAFGAKMWIERRIPMPTGANKRGAG